MTKGKRLVRLAVLCGVVSMILNSSMDLPIPIADANAIPVTTPGAGDYPELPVILMPVLMVFAGFAARRIRRNAMRSAA